MALVVLLRGVNVGGHRTFRPAALARALSHLDAVNIGAAGTFVIRRPVARTRVRAELARRVPFDVDVAICQGREILDLISRAFFSGHPTSSDIVRFVSMLCGPPRSAPATPFSFPATGEWLLKVIAREGRFVVGMYRRQMKAIGYLARLDRAFGVPVTTRNWNTMAAIAKALGPSSR